MKQFVIPPIKHLELSAGGSAGYFVLAHLWLQSEEYRDFYKEKQSRGNYILLDNGAAESSLVDLDTLISIVVDLNPSEVIARDVLFDGKETKKATSESIESLLKIGYTGKIMGVPQGESVSEWLDCYDYMINHQDVTTIGLSKLSVPRVFGNYSNDQGIMESRHACYHLLSASQKIVKEIHCLGMGDPNEYSYYKDDPLMRSTDSCNSVWSAMNGIDWNKNNFKRIKTPHDYFDRDMSAEQYGLAIENAKYLERVMKSV